MSIRIVCLALLVACSSSDDKKPKPAATETQQPAPPPEEARPAPALPDAKPAAPPEPEPTTPAEIDKAFKHAMIDGRDKDVLKYCGMQKLDGKSNPQALMGCALAACRSKDGDTAQRYAGLMSGSKTGKQLLVQVQKVCTANNVAL